MITAEQHREFMAAAAIDSDLDFAFRLQLEEAINASKTLTNPQNDVVMTDAQPEPEPMIITEAVYIPHGEGSSNTKNFDEEKVFRVYFKGIVSEESVWNKRKVNLAGIGVAICDMKGEVVFEKRKEVEVVRGEKVSKGSVEGMALLEALNGAVAFGVKRVVLCFDYHTLFQYVSGRWQPKQQKIQTFVDEVNLLRKKFTHCEPSLIAKRDVKLAYKLAREAVSSQITKAMESSKKIENCVICLEDKSMDQFFSVKGCNHEYCRDCMKQHVEAKLRDGMMPRCPNEGCESELKIDGCENILTPKLAEMMKQLLKEASIPVTEKFYCPYPKCSTLMSKTEVHQLPRSIYEIGARMCDKCHGSFCISCRVPWHKNMDCAEYKRRNPNPLVQESKLKNLAAQNLWRQCIKCKHMIELATGCYHMTCRCGYEFCYTCGAEWKNKKATCSCPLWDEENIVDSEESDDDFGVEHEVGLLHLHLYEPESDDDDLF
ncbi:IBR domain-containing protein [Tanacetum coccineum]